MKRLLKKIRNKTTAKILIFSPVDLEGWPTGAIIYQDADKFIKAIESHWNSKEGNCYVVVDEFQALHDHYRSYQRYPAALKQLTSIGRHKGIIAIIGAQRPMVIPPTIRNNCARKVIFSLSGEADQKIIENEAPRNTVNGVKISRKISGLKKLHFIQIDGDEIEMKSIQ